MGGLEFICLLRACAGSKESVNVVFAGF